jgi:probable O-glycosylation ligase (exosortase A-associated)
MLILPIALSIMPQQWFDRMDTIRNYEEDTSAQGRLNAWQFAFNLAVDRPFVGGGFETFDRALFAVYAPNPTDVRDAHSIYFEVLGEHGFVGLALFLGLGISLWRGCSLTIRRTRDDPDLVEYEHLLRMVQVSFIAYATSGAFLGLAYFDLFYNLVAIAVIAKVWVREHIGARADVGTSNTHRPGMRGRLAVQKA